MANLDIITRLRNMASTGIGEVKADLKGMEAAAQGADFKAAALEQRTRLLGQEMNRLAKEVAQSKISVGDAQKQYDEFEKKLVKIEEVAPKVADSLDEMDDGASKSHLSFTELNQALELVEKGFELVVGVSRQLYDTIGEGAKIDAAANTFEHLAESINTTSDSLMGTLHAATSGMVSDADSMVAANRFVAMGLANTQEEAGELASIATQLGVAFRGDAVSGMEELALMLANQSIPRLDSFGVSAGAVRTRITELMEANQGMTREAAFMQAFMEQAQVTIGKIGPQSETAAAGLARIESAVQNMGDEVKSTVADEFAPLMDKLATDVLPKLAQVTSENVVPAISEMVGLFGDIVNDGGSAEDQINSLGDAFDVLTETVQTIRDVRNNIADTSRVMRIMMQDGQQIKELLGIGFTLAGNAVDYFSNMLQGDGRGALAAYNAQAREFYELFGGLPIIGSLLNKAIESTTATLDQGANATSRFTKEVEGEIDALTLEQNAVKESAEAHELANHWTLEHARGVKEAADAAYLSGDAYGEFQDKLVQGNAHLTENEAKIAAANAATKAKADADRLAAEATRQHAEEVAALNVKMGDYFAEAAQGGNELELFAHNLDELGEQTYTVTNLTSDQQAEMDRLQGAYEKAAQTIRDYELGIKGATMTDEERNSKIEEQRTIMATLEASMQPLIAAGTSVVSTNNALTFSTDAVASSLFGVVSASDAGAFSIAAAGLALGQFTPQAAEAYLKTAILKIEMDKLATSFAETGNVNDLVTGMQEAMTSVEGLTLSINGADGSVHMIDDTLATTTQTTEEMIAKFGEVPDEIETEVINDAEEEIGAVQRYITELGNIPASVTTQVQTVGGGGQAGTNYGAGGYQEMSQGGEVTGGIPGRDSVPALLMPGERVLTVEENQKWKQWQRSSGNSATGDELANGFFGGANQGVGDGAFGGGGINFTFAPQFVVTGAIGPDTLSQLDTMIRKSTREALDELNRRSSALTRMRT